MHRTSAPSLALLAGVLAVAAIVVGVALNVTAAPTSLARWDALRDLGWLGFPVVGALIAVRRGDVRLAWLLVAAGLALGLATLGGALHARSFAWQVGPTAQGQVGLVLGYFYPTGAMLLAAALLRFPSDRLGSRLARLHHAVLVTAAVLHLLRLVAPVLAGPDDVLVENPLAVPALAGVADVALTATGVGLISAGLAVIHVTLRGLWSRGIEREQMKWLAYAAGLYIVAMLGIGAGILLGGDPDAFEPVATIAVVVCFNGMAAAMGVAVLRHRLFEIDRLLSRTASYLVLTVLLAGIYWVGVLGLGRVASALGAGLGGDLAVAASTLAVAAAFRPLRRRVQTVVDRRFDRAHYDAARTVERFASRLRDEVDLQVLQDEVARTAATALSPTHTAVWLAPSPSRP